MHIHVYSHDISCASKNLFDAHTVSQVLAYLQHGGREQIACWSHQIENTIWHGQHPLLHLGASLTYRFSRN